MESKIKGNKWIFHVIGFSVVLVILVVAVDYVTGKNVYHNAVWEKIQDPEQNIDVLIIGNSHAYTSIDAEVLSEGIGKEVDILGAGSANMEEILAAMKIVLAYEKPEIIAIDVYTVCSDTREQLQNEKRGLLYDNLDGVNNYVRKICGVIQTFKFRNVLDGTFQIFRPTSMWTRWEDNISSKYDEHGFARRNSMVHGNDILKECQKAVEEIYINDETDEITEYNEKSFIAFLELMEENEIPVIIFSIPTLDPSISRRVNTIFKLAAEFDNVILYAEDMALNTDRIELSLEDYYDISHVNQRGAEKITQYFGKILQTCIGVQVDFEHVFAYKTESIKEVSDGMFIYLVENYSKDCMYQFRLLVDGHIIDKQDYSEKNTYICEYDIRCSDNMRMICYMIPTDEVGLEDKAPSRIQVEFLKVNNCYIE